MIHSRHTCLIRAFICLCCAFSPVAAWSQQTPPANPPANAPAPKSQNPFETVPQSPDEAKPEAPKPEQAKPDAPKPEQPKQENKPAPFDVPKTAEEAAPEARSNNVEAIE